MRNLTRFLVALGLVACKGQAPTEMNRLPPPTLSVSAATHVLPVAGGAPVLEVSATLRNATTSAIRVAVGPACPLAVQLFPDPTGQYAGSLDPTTTCPSGATTLALAPGDTTVLTRRLGADTLASFAPGAYGVSVAVTTSTALIGVWAGAVELPLASPPSPARRTDLP
jgi:hypothetical protein